MDIDYPRFVEQRKRAPASGLHGSWNNEQDQQLKIKPMDFKKEIGLRIRAARKSKGWILADLERETGDVLSRSRISNYEQGDRLPSPEDVVILARALERRAAYMMCMEDEQEEALIKNWRTLSEKDRMAFYRKLEVAAMQNRDPVRDPRRAAPVYPRSKVAK